ncbi:hypothetical protein AB1N83_004228 [Pleurotus pulmonarius]
MVRCPATPRRERVTDLALCQGSLSQNLVQRVDWECDGLPPIVQPKSVSKVLYCPRNSRPATLPGPLSGSGGSALVPPRRGLEVIITGVNRL